MICLAVCLVGIDLRDIFTRGEHLLEAIQVAVDTLAIGSPRRVLHVSSDSLFEQGSTVGILSGQFETPRWLREGSSAHGLIWVQHGLSPCLTLGTGTPNNLGPPKLVLPRLGALVTDTWSTEHLMECQLLYELSPSVRRCPKLLNIVLSIAFVV